MKTKEDCFLLGSVAKIVGFKGLLSLKIDADTPAHYTKLDAFYLDINKQLVPFFIKEIKINDRGFAKVELEGVTTEEAARLLVGKEIHLPLEQLPPLKENQFYYHEIVGFDVVDKEKGIIGKITEVIDHTAQPVFQIQAGDKEVLIPIIDEFIEKVDKPNKTINVKTPEGLIDLYLGTVMK